MKEQNKSELLAKTLQDMYYKGHNENVTLQQLIKDAGAMLRPLVTKKLNK